MPLTSYTIERTFPVSQERLFRALTDPEDLKVWVWGSEGRDVEADVDLKVGGQVRTTTRVDRPDGNEERAGFRGVFALIEPPRRLVHTVHWDASVGYNAPGMNPVDEVIAAEVEPCAEGCRLRYTHLGIPDDGVSAAEHERSVRITLDVLERHLRD